MYVFIIPVLILASLLVWFSFKKDHVLEERQSVLGCKGYCVTDILPNETGVCRINMDGKHKIILCRAAYSKIAEGSLILVVDYIDDIFIVEKSGLKI